MSESGLSDVVCRVQLDEEMPALLMNWVPRKLAPQIRCVFTMIDSTPQHKALTQREPQPFSLQLTPLNDDDRQVCRCRTAGQV